MKEKLQKVRETLDNIPTMYAIGLYTDANASFAESVALIDTILATLDSEESSLKMTMKTLQEIQDVHDEFGFGCFRARKVLKKITDKKAAIDAIKS